MPTYSVTVGRDIHQTLVLTVDATSSEEASEIAISLAGNAFESEWEYEDLGGDMLIDDIDDVTDFDEEDE
jgi:hypothetical protein